MVRGSTGAGYGVFYRGMRHIRIYDDFKRHLANLENKKNKEKNKEVLKKK